MRSDDWLLAQLPVGMSEDDFFRRFLQIFQDVSNTVLQQVDTLDRAFDPAVAPDQMVREMGRWIGLDWLDSSQAELTQRTAVREYAKILAYRGTKQGLVGLLQLISESDDVTVEDNGGVFHEGEAPGRPPHVHLRMATAGWAHPDDIVRIVRAELPATVTFDLVVAGVSVWPPEDSAGGEERVEMEIG